MLLLCCFFPLPRMPSNYMSCPPALQTQWISHGERIRRKREERHRKQRRKRARSGMDKARGGGK